MNPATSLDAVRAETAAADHWLHLCNLGRSHTAPIASDTAPMGTILQTVHRPGLALLETLRPPVCLRNRSAAGIHL